MFKKIIVTLLICICFCAVLNIVSASGLLDSIIDQGNDFSDGANNSSLFGTIDAFLRTSIAPTIGLIGNLIFAAVTVILGAKYVWSSAEGKASVLESLPTFVIAVIMFYLAGTVVDVVQVTTSGVGNAGNWAALSGNIIWIINSVVKYATLAGIIVIGVKYLFASAEGRASMKISLGGAVIGLVFVFLSSNIVELIVRFGNDVLN